MLLDCAQVPGFPGLFLLIEQLVDLILQLPVGARERAHQRMLGRKLHAGCAKDRIHAGGEDTNSLTV